MAIVIADAFHAAANVNYPAPGAPAFDGSPNGFSEVLVRNGPGDFTLELDQDLNVMDRTVHATPYSGATVAIVTTEDVDDTHVRIRTFDAAGAALDNVPVSVGVWRHQIES